MAFDASVVCPLATIKATLVPYGGHRAGTRKYLIRRAHTKRPAWCLVPRRNLRLRFDLCSESN